MAIFYWVKFSKNLSNIFILSNKNSQEKLLFESQYAPIKAAGRTPSGYDSHHTELKKDPPLQFWQDSL